MNDQRITVKHISLAILTVLFTWILHEFVHWLTGELLGYESIMRLNGTSFVNGPIDNEAHKALVSISAPIFTVLQGVVAYFYLKSRGWNKYIYSILFAAFYMRLFAGIMNIFMANDEARVGQYLGIGTFTISIAFSVLLFSMVYKVSIKHKLKRKFQAWTIMTILVSGWLIIIADQMIGIRLL